MNEGNNLATNLTTNARTDATTRRPALRLLPIAALLLTLGGCAVMPESVSDADRQNRVQQDLQTLFKDVEPVAGEVTVHEAFARALKYNYDYRLRAMEQSMASAQADLSKFDLLPRLTVSAGYDSRSNDAGSRSIDLSTGVENRVFTGGQERNRNTANAVLAWNVLDFGVSYVRAQQQATQVLIAEERKRKVVQNISQDVRQAFWRAYGAQQALPKLDALMVRVREALGRSEKLEKERLMPPLQALAFQRSLLDLHQQIVARRQDLILAQTELAALMNVRPGTAIKLASSGLEKDALNLQPLNDLDAMDLAALKNRPELREEDYRKKISVLEARRAMLSLLPGIELNLSTNHDSNKFLFHNNWSEASSTISFNLLRAFSYPAQKRAAEAQAQVDDTRRVALGMAVLTQVRIAARRYQEAQEDYTLAVQASEIDARIEKNTRASAKASAESEMEVLRSEVKAALSEMQRYAALASLQTAYARVANSVGADLIPEVPKTADLKTFTQQLADADTTWRNTRFNTASLNPGPKPVVALGKIEAPSQLDVSGALRTQLGEQGVDVSEQAAAQVSATTQVGQPSGGVRQVEIVFALKRGDQVLGTVPFRSVISDASPNAWNVFASAASEVAAGKFGDLLKQENSAQEAQKVAQ
jgi:outer membrane protein TolC